MIHTSQLRPADERLNRPIPEAASEGSVIMKVMAEFKVLRHAWCPENRSALMKRVLDALSQAGELEKVEMGAVSADIARPVGDSCRVCGWIHDAGFSQIIMGGNGTILLRGRLPDIVGLVHAANEKGLALSTKDDGLLHACGGYHNPCKAFDDLKCREAYKRLFDTSRRGFISLQGALGRNRNKTEARPE